MMRDSVFVIVVVYFAPELGKFHRKIAENCFATFPIPYKLPLKREK